MTTPSQTATWTVETWRRMRDDFRRDPIAAADAWTAYVTSLETVAQRVANEMCDRLKADINNPTCRSPVEAERLPRSKWCVSCEAREVTNA